MAIETDECIDWPYGQNSYGYGTVGYENRSITCSLLVLQLRTSETHPGHSMEAAHSCNRRICMNYRHLSWKTPQQNQDDRIAHGTTMKGAQMPTAVLSEADVLEIRALRAAGRTQASIGEQFGVCPSHVSRIVRRQFWKEV